MKALQSCAQLISRHGHGLAAMIAKRRPDDCGSGWLDAFDLRVNKAAYPDASQFDGKSPYFDPKATRAAPRWLNVDVTLVKKTRLISLSELRATPELETMRVLQRGNRLSITPVTSQEWKIVERMATRLA